MEVKNNLHNMVKNTYLYMVYEASRSGLWTCLGHKLNFKGRFIMPLADKKCQTTLMTRQ